MTSWTVGHTDRFRAAVVGAPVSDLVSMFGEGDIPLFDIYELGGSPFDNPAEYRNRSPVTYLPNVKTPVLLVHMEGDLRCPIGQSEEIFQGLKVLGKKVEFIRYPGGFHGVQTPSQQLDRLRRTIAWYERHAPRKPRRTTDWKRTRRTGKRVKKSSRASAAERNLPVRYDERVPYIVDELQRMERSATVPELFDILEADMFLTQRRVAATLREFGGRRRGVEPMFEKDGYDKDGYARWKLRKPSRDGGGKRQRVSRNGHAQRAKRKARPLRSRQASGVR